MTSHKPRAAVRHSSCTTEFVTVAAAPWQPKIRAPRWMAIGAAAVVMAAQPAAAVADSGSGGSSGSQYGGGRTVAASQVSGDGSTFADGTDPFTSPNAPKGKRVHPTRILGDNMPGIRTPFATGSQGLVDGSGLKWFVNTNITFSSTSSASGAASEASFTGPVAASTLNGGTTMSTLNDMFDGYNSMGVHLGTTPQSGPQQTRVAAFTIYDKNGAAATPTDCGGREVLYNPQTVMQNTDGPIQMSRTVYVSPTSDYARWLNSFTNTSATPQTVTMYTGNNLGSDNNTMITGTSSGDLTADTSDNWVTSFQNWSGNTSSDVRQGSVIEGPHAATPLTELHYVNGDDNPFWDYTFTLAPGQTSIILNYAVGTATQAQSRTDAAALDANPSTDCMTPTQIGEVLNFDHPTVTPSVSGTTTEEATGSSGAPVNFTATETHSDGTTEPITCDHPSGSSFPVGTTPVTCGPNTPLGTSGAFSVVVQDTTPPNIVVPTHFSLITPGAADSHVTWTGPTATDLVDGSVPVTCDHAPGDLFPVGSTTVSCSATDAHHNTATASFNVVVNDTTPPVITTPSSFTYGVTTLQGTPVSWTALSATDAVDGSVPVKCDHTSGALLPHGFTTVSCTATDAAGNTSSASFIIDVVGNSLVITVQPVTVSANTLATKGVVLQIVCTERCRAAGRLYVSHSLAKTLGLTHEARTPGGILLGYSSSFEPAQGTMTLRVKLSPQAIAALRKHKHSVFQDATTITDGHVTQTTNRSIAVKG